MNIPLLSLLAAAVSCTASAFAAGGVAPKPSDPLAWPAINQDNMPGTRWWWMGSAVEPDELKRELKTFRDAGLGTVEITPIYGVKGSERQFIEYLSPPWMERLKVAATEARKLDVNVDMVTGTGWCFGGPNVGTQDANALAVVKTFDVAAGTSLPGQFDRKATEALSAFSPDGKFLDLTDKIAPDGTVDWQPAGEGQWRVYAVSQKPSGVKVKRSAPGGAGWMLNLLYPDAMPRYLQRFSEAFSSYDGPKPCAQFHDSYEYTSDWAPDFLAQFEKRRGYRLQGEFPAVFEARGDADHVARVKCDYRETVSELVEESIAEWTQWSHGLGCVSRNQAHGSPGNWLDIYAASDVPETEMFSKDRDILVSKFASSAAHVTGKKIVSSETGTWVAEHFQETLADLKYLCDDMFLAGVNRIMYHGTTYSPADAPWPGWLFYASTQMNPRNAIWHDVPALNTYVARVQSVLQNSRPDNDVLLYWPIHDQWSDASNLKPVIRPFTIHARDWFGDQSIGKTARLLWERGYTFDYISDKQLRAAKTDHGALDLFGSRYSAVVVPACVHMPPETLQTLLALADGGATIIFQDHAPQDVPGFGNLERRVGELRQLAPRAASLIVSTAQLEPALDKAGARRELALASRPGIHFVRRATPDGGVYFVASRGAERLDQRIKLAGTATRAAILDPMTGQAGLAEVNTEGVRLQLEPGESLLVRTLGNPPPENVARYGYRQPTGEPVTLGGTWEVKFTEGGPTLPKTFTTEQLGSWTETGDEEARNFGGTALYTLRFAASVTPEKSKHWSIDLGKVCQSARVRLNGRDLGTVFIPPFRVTADELHSTDNLLEVEVTSTSANRIRDLDMRGVEWKIFYDVNIVNRDYKPFDASKWPVAPAGLIGPVTLHAEP